MNEARHNFVHATHVLKEIWHVGWKNISNKVDQMVEHCDWPWTYNYYKWKDVTTCMKPISKMEFSIQMKVWMKGCSCMKCIANVIDQLG
jgi:hypothetical protein